MSLTTGYVVNTWCEIPEMFTMSIFLFFLRSLIRTLDIELQSDGIALSASPRKGAHFPRASSAVPLASVKLMTSCARQKNPSIPSRPNQDGRVQLHLVVCLRLVRRCATVRWAGQGNTARTSEFRGTHISQSETAAALVSALFCPALVCTSDDRRLPTYCGTHSSRSSRAAASCCRGPATRLGMAV